MTAPAAPTLPEAHHDLAVRVGAALQARGWLVATAESCTGGMVAAAITDIAGSSGWFERGFVSYSNQSKVDLLGVPVALLKEHGAVSAPCARAMAEGALERSRAQVSLAITGIAGPGGGSADKPVGTVHFAWAGGGLPVQDAVRCFAGTRAEVRAQSLRFALETLLTRLAPH